MGESAGPAETAEIVGGGRKGRSKRQTHSRRHTHWENGVDGRRVRVVRDELRQMGVEIRAGEGSRNEGEKGMSQSNRGRGQTLFERDRDIWKGTQGKGETQTRKEQK